MNALRHVTYRVREPWVPAEVLVTEMTLSERIKYVRTNLLDESGKEMTQPAFQKAVGKAAGHHGVVAWEKRGTEPRPSAREAISELTGGAYPPALFSRRGAEGVVTESIGLRLRQLEDQAAGARVVFRALLEGLAAAGVQVPLSPEAAEFLATPAPAVTGGR